MRESTRRTRSAAAGPEAARSPARAAGASAAFHRAVAASLFADVRAAGVLGGADDAAARREWDAVALHACVRGLVSAGDPAAETADRVDEFHDEVLPGLAPAAEVPALRAFLAERYAEYDGIARTLGKAGAADVPAAIAAAFARRVRAADPRALADTVAPLLEALAEGAAAAREGGTGAAAEGDAGGTAVSLPPLDPLLALTARLEGAGFAWAVGASALLASLGLAREVNDWDVQVDASPEALRRLFAGVPHTFHGHGGCHADWKLSFADARCELIPGFAFFVPGGVVRVPLRVSGRWRELPIASPEGWACAYWLMGRFDEPPLRARRAERAEALLRWLASHGADEARLAEMLAEPLPAPLADRLRSLLLA